MILLMLHDFPVSLPAVALAQDAHANWTSVAAAAHLYV